jgi:hypothetical protein
MRATSLIWLGVIVSTGIAVFSVKSAVAGLEEELLRVRKEMAQDHAAIHVLNAEWSYLNQPTRLADLAKRFLPKLQPVATVQYGAPARLEQLPWKAGEGPVADTAPAPSPAPGAAAVASAAPLPPPVPGAKRPR